MFILLLGLKSPGVNADFSAREEHESGPKHGVPFPEVSSPLTLSYLLLLVRDVFGLLFFSGLHVGWCRIKEHFLSLCLEPKC